MKKENLNSYETLEKEIIELMKALIAIESPYFQEEEIMSFVNSWFHNHQLESYLHTYVDKKVTKFEGKNVVLIQQGNQPGPTVCLNGHLDTVSLCKGWTENPFEGTVKDGDIYGLGALDMKSGCSAIMLAVKRFSERHRRFKGKILVTLVSDEEGPYGLGTNALIEDGLLADVDFSIIAEPSAAFLEKPFPAICLGARGGYGVEIELFGKSAHAAIPEHGINAATDAAKVVSALKDVHYFQDELLGKGSLCVVGMESDGGACSVPDYATIKLFWHIVRNENESSIHKEIEKAIKRADISCQYQIHFREAPSEGSKGFLPYTVERSNTFVDTFIRVAEQVCGQEMSIGYLQSIGDFNYLGSRLQAPAVIFGAAGQGLHGSNEHASIDSIVKTSETIYNFLEEILL
ncbi:M20 family metallopeptidase [Aminipila butyrica]|uniref:M20 family metallopeptidase n=1 Tax=Aminipila butyrica TaxID=433296 RepID=A0A858BV09_9FIRM|nr:M20/M25/M40 family metallo-hydrolase [Aminipila butyrica]QIB68928.1 M20 family metallopeptidase [Aminipila butyrica]